MTAVYRRPPDFRPGPSRLFLLLYAASVAAGSASAAFSNTGTITGSGALAGTASLSFSTTATWSGADTLVGSVALVFTQNAPLQGTGALAGEATQVFTTSGTSSFTTAFNIVSFQKKRTPWREPRWNYNYNNKLVIFPLSVESGISGQCDISFGATSGTLLGTAAIAGVAPITITPVGLVRGSGALASAAALTFTVAGDATGTASGDVSGIATLTITPTALLEGIGHLSGSATNVFTASLIKGSVVQLEGTTDLTFSAAGALLAIAESTTTPRRRSYVIRRGAR